MRKLMCALAVTAACGLAAGEETSGNSGETAETAESLAEEASKPFEAGFDLDFLSAYVWRNAVQTDRLVLEPCVWADLTHFEPFYLGFSVWQNYDVTGRRRGMGNLFRQALNETDYNIHAGVTAWEGEESSLGLELGHEWYTYQGRYADVRGECPDTRELYAKATFDNPIVGVYGQASWMYGDFGDYLRAWHYEIGFTKEVEVVESVTLGADWNVNFGDRRYLGYLYGGDACGFGGTTFKLSAAWAITDYLTLKGTLAYTGVLNGDLRDSLDEQGSDAWYGSDSYPRDLLWGGLSLSVSF